MLFNNAIFEALSRQTHIKNAISQEEENQEQPLFNKIKPNEGISFVDSVKPIENVGTFSPKPENNNFNANTELRFEKSYSLNEVEIFTEPKPVTPKIDVASIDEKSEQITYKNLFAPTKQIIGVAFKTYIIIQEGDMLYFIDQHAAHERHLFEKFMKELDEQKVQVQELLVPYVLNVNDKEAEFLDENLSVLSKQGFDICEFGKNCYKISAVPLLLQGVNLKEYFDEVLSNLSGYMKKPHEFTRITIATMACKAAIKAGNKLSDEEIDILLTQLKENNNTLLCPHGRPVVITFERKQLEKMFKRIV